MNTHHDLIQSLTGNDGELILQFFVTFSRFEYALKRAKFIKQPNNKKANNDKYNNAEPDWDRFTSRIENSLATISDTKFKEAKDYLVQNPPQKQIRKPDNSLGWKKNEQNGQCDTEYLLRLVRCVRNNLFHGGKYPDGPVDGQSLRNSKLLQHCLTILENCAPLDADVKRFFEDLHEE